MECVVGGLDGVGVAALERFADGGDLAFDVGLLIAGNLIAEILDLLLALVGEVVGVVADFDGFLGLLVLLGVNLGVALHLLDLLLRESGAAGDGDFLLLTRAEILGADVQDAIGISVESHLDLRDAPRRGWDAVEVKGAKVLVVAAERALTLQDLDLHARLAVAVGGKDLRFPRRDGGVARDHGRGDTAGGFDGQRERRDIEEEHVFHVALEHAALDGRADGDDFIRVDALVRLFADELARGFDDAGHAGHATHEHEFVDVFLAQAGVLEARLDRADGALEKRVGELLQFRAGEFFLDVLRAALVGGDKGQVDLVFLRRGKRDLGLLGLLLDALHGVGLLGEVDAGLTFEFGENPIHDGVVPVVAAEMGVAVGRFHFEDAVADFQYRDVESAATEVIDRDLLVGLFVEAIGERGGSRLVDDAEHVEARDLAGVLGRGALRVVEISRHRDDGLGDRLAELGFRVGFELREDHRADFRRRIGLGLAVHGHGNVRVTVRRLHDFVRHAMQFALHLVEFPPHEALHGKDRVCGVRDRLPFRGLADHALAALGESDDAGRGPRAFGVFQHDRFAAVHDRHTGVRGAEVDAEDFSHVSKKSWV